MKAHFVKKQPEGEDITTFYFEPEQPIDFIAGQFIELRLPITSPDPRDTKRWFSISASPTEPFIAITTRIPTTSPSVFKRALQMLKVSDSIDISQAMGDFVLPKDHTIPLLFIAAGIGITPFRSITKWLIDSSDQRQVTILQAINKPGDAIFRDVFEAYDCKYTTLISDRLTAKIIRSHIHSNKTKLYIAGPEPMVEELSKAMIDSGYPASLVAGDYFPGYDAI